MRRPLSILDFAAIVRVRRDGRTPLAPALRPRRIRGRAQRQNFWGTAGAGVLPIALSTGRLLIGLRSENVMEGGTWGTWGGAIAGTGEGDMEPEEGALREFEEETGWDRDGLVAVEPAYVFRARKFAYYNFLLILEDEFTPDLNWEADEAEWFALDNLPEPMHFGLQALLDDAASMERIEHWTSQAKRGRRAHG